MRSRASSGKSTDRSYDRVARGGAIETVELALSARIVTRLRAIEDELRDLAAFIPLWLRSVENRRALMLRPKDDSTPKTPGPSQSEPE